MRVCGGGAIINHFQNSGGAAPQPGGGSGGAAGVIEGGGGGGGGGDPKLPEAARVVAPHEGPAPRHAAAQPQRELGTADAAAQRDDEIAICGGAHRNRSSSA